MLPSRPRKSLLLSLALVLLLVSPSRASECLPDEMNLAQTREYLGTKYKETLEFVGSISRGTGFMSIFGYRSDNNEGRTWTTFVSKSNGCGGFGLSGDFYLIRRIGPVGQPIAQ